MRLTIAAIGRLKDDAERVLVDRYLERLGLGRTLGISPVREVEIAEGRQPSAEARRTHEAGRLLQAAETADVIVLLDCEGRSLASGAFARWIGERRDSGTKHMAFLIGGPDGHGGAAHTRASLVLSLGAMTLPHGLARVVLVEQLYRAVTILAGHPYHRA